MIILATDGITVSIFAKRTATLLAATAMAVSISLGSGAGTAAAAPTLTYDVYWSQTNKSAIYYLYANGDYAGFVEWHADPVGSTPGDALRARDSSAEGWGVEATVSTITIGYSRTASTRGEPSPYTTPWNTGNLEEGTKLRLTGCLVKGSEEVCTAGHHVYA